MVAHLFAGMALAATSAFVPVQLDQMGTAQTCGPILTSGYEIPTPDPGDRTWCLDTSPQAGGFRADPTGPEPILHATATRPTSAAVPTPHGCNEGCCCVMSTTR